MNIETFVGEIAEQFDDISTDSFGPETEFKENEEWSSMTALSIIAMVDQNYSTRLTGDDIRNATTIQHIYDIVSSRVA